MRIAITLAAATLFGLAGCKPPEDDHSHDFKPLHGGQRIDLADHGPMIEVVHDEKAGTIKVYVFDAHQKAQKTDKAPVLRLTEGEPTQITGVGADAEWTFTDEKLKGHPHGVEFKLEIGGKPYTNKSWHPPE